MPIWVNSRTGERKGPARRGFFALFGVLATVFFLQSGCSSSAPRFRSPSGASQPRERQQPAEQGRRFATREAEEEHREDDKRPAPEVVKEVATGSRSFRTEKNTAIAPLDHSRMMREISRYMGVPYVLGGEDMKGMDCSGYTMVVYKNSMNTPLPRTSADQYGLGIKVEKPELQFGDLVFFNTTGEAASHVGIYLGDDLFAHASVSQGVTVSSLESSYYERRYQGARRLIH